MSNSEQLVLSKSKRKKIVSNPNPLWSRLGKKLPTGKMSYQNGTNNETENPKLIRKKN